MPIYLPETNTELVRLPFQLRAPIRPSSCSRSIPTSHHANYRLYSIHRAHVALPHRICSYLMVTELVRLAFQLPAPIRSPPAPARSRPFITSTNISTAYKGPILTSPIAVMHVCPWPSPCGTVSGFERQSTSTSATARLQLPATSKTLSTSRNGSPPLSDGQFAQVWVMPGPCSSNFGFLAPIRLSRAHAYSSPPPCQ